MANFINVSDVIREHPILDICSTNGSPIRVLQWQPKANYNLDIDRGVYLETEFFQKMAHEYIKLAKSTKAELVLTPEYSFPNSTLDYIIGEKDLWPDERKLWAICIQGDSKEDIVSRIEAWKRMPNLKVYPDALGDLSGGNFVSALIYLFIDAVGDLVVLPQFKTGSMADARNNFEGPGLCRGSIIYVFNLAEAASSQNRFLSLICADVFYIPARRIIEQVDGRCILISHPQLNQNPRHENIVSFRKDFFRTDEKDIRIITLNSAEGTTVGGYEFNLPWSAFYKKQSTDLANDRQRLNKQLNHKKGTGYISDNHMEIWFSARFEHCKLITLSKGDNGSSCSVVSHRDEPITDMCYKFVDDRWVESPFCMSNINDALGMYGLGNPFPYPVCLSGQRCDQCRSSDYFFGSFTGQFENGEIECSNELMSRVLVGSDRISDSARERKIFLLMELKRLLDSGVLPPALGYFKNNYRFEISEYFPNHGVDNYNLVPLCSEITEPEVLEIMDPEALVVITDMILESEVEGLVKELSKKLHKRYRNQILVYYRSITGSGYQIFDRHLSDGRISDPRFSRNMSSFKRPNTMM